ncbi:MAG TPA: GspE/PulE family protein, partial [bacterium]|nr:GspE/PulE family protein [bacterium]
YTKVRYRIDGVLREHHRLPRKAHNAVVARYKIMSGLNIAEKRKPQDGRIKFKNFGKSNPDIEMRVSIIPLYWGEKICMRILAKVDKALTLEKLGFSEHNLKLYEAAIEKPWGMILNVGPTGSGKTTTLYAGLAQMNTPEVNISTAEDPVEIMLEGVNQMPIRHEIGVNFAAALRSFLRQDPDIIMVGEIRDFETAEISIEAALTGHLVLSTLHTNDAATTVTRFIEMGIEPFLVTSTILLVCAQRLVRKVCSECGTPYEGIPEECDELRVPRGTRLFKGAGCKKCDGTGYKGRLGIHEILVPSEEIKKLVIKKGTSDDINKLALAAGMIPLFHDGVEKALKGLTSSEEVFRVLRAE